MRFCVSVFDIIVFVPTCQFVVILGALQRKKKSEIQVSLGIVLWKIFPK